MRTLRQAFTALALTFALTLSAFAGDISTTVAPPSAPSQGEMPNDVAGDMHTGKSEAAAADDSVAALLGLFGSVLSLL